MMKQNTEPRMQTCPPLRRYRIRMLSGLLCPFCGAELRRTDVEETDEGWRLICSSSLGCHQAALICDEVR